MKNNKKLFGCLKIKLKIKVQYAIEFIYLKKYKLIENGLTFNIKLTKSSIVEWVINTCIKIKKSKKLKLRENLI